MELSKLDAEIEKDEEIVDVPIYKKNGEPYLARDGSPSTIGFLGSDSRKVREAKDAVQRKMLRTRSTKLEPADIRQNRITVAAAGVARWHGWEAGETDAPCTSENVRSLFKAEHILVQAEQAIDGHADFFVSNSSS